MRIAPAPRIGALNTSATTAPNGRSYPDSADREHIHVLAVLRDERRAGVSILRHAEAALPAAASRRAPHHARSAAVVATGQLPFHDTSRLRGGLDARPVPAGGKGQGAEHGEQTTPQPHSRARVAREREVGDELAHWTSRGEGSSTGA